jgi:hypothetical protein
MPGGRPYGFDGSWRDMGYWSNYDDSDVAYNRAPQPEGGDRSRKLRQWLGRVATNAVRSFGAWGSIHVSLPFASTWEPTPVPESVLDAVPAAVEPAPYPGPIEDPVVAAYAAELATVEPFADFLARFEKPE